jgi:ferrochelatase
MVEPNSSADAVLLLAHGTPETLDEIPQYLMNVTSGRPLPESVIAEITHRYSLIGKSPLTEITLAQARALAQTLGLPVYVGMRNWKPYIADAVRQMREAGVRRAVAICLAPQNSRTSVGLYKRAVLAEAGAAMQIEFVEDWAEHPLLIRAFAEKLRSRWTDSCREHGSAVPIIFTAHSVPCRTLWSMSAIPLDAEVSNHAAGAARPPVAQTPDPYAQQAKRTAELVADSLAPDGLRRKDCFFAFQSQGASGGPWVGPSVEATLEALANSGCKRVLIQPVGFLCDHVEILYDIDIAFRDTGRRLGVEVERTESLNDAHDLIAALSDLATSAMKRLGA